ncbi:uncharacterized protein LOC132921341 [Rhopalosiphum padi]|uniref:uncharacterized protein LOC132921341 n=1 Tax=Rhopalosiphum padi TaxID=40932 RepID=UPI00298E7430|nr:uncharacterized protein LOC132921341 [Rhopalosiphum padi]
MNMTFDISILEPKEVCINLKLLKLFHFFHLFDPKIKTICNFNVYHIALYIINCVIGCILMFGMVGYFTEADNEINIFTDVQSMFCCLVYFLCLVKIITFVNKTNNIWDLLRVTCINFLSSTQCQKNVGILHNYREKLIKTTNYITVILIVLTIQWSLYPLVLLWLQREDAKQSSRRFENVFNFRFPVTISYYNNNFAIFYIIEESIGLLLFYMHLMSEVFYISICYVMIAQYEMIQKAYKNVNSELNSKNINGNKHDINGNDCFDDLVSIMNDQQKLFTKLKLFYSTYTFITLSNVVSYSGSIIILTYASVLVFTTSEAIPMFYVIKLISAFGYMIIILLLVCYLLERINNKKESVNFEMYSCNWTTMNLRSKKMLLLSMQLNNANELTIKITPRRIINLQFFNSVMITCYNIISAMLNISSK